MVANTKTKGFSPRRLAELASLLICILLLLPSTRALAHGGHDDPFTVTFDQNLNESVPADLTFRDETGAVVRLGDVLGGKAAVLLLGYYNCETLCSVVFPETAETLNAISLSPGDDYEVIAVSIDPRETAVNARAKQQELGVGDWHFLTGKTEAIEQLAQAVGFHYGYDAETDQYAHPSGLVILTPGGTIARYVYGVEFPAKDVRLALVEAGQGTVGSPVDQLLLLCYHYDAESGRYTGLITTLLRGAGALTIAALGATIFVLKRRE